MNTTITIHEIKQKPVDIRRWEQVKAQEAIWKEEDDALCRILWLAYCNNENMLFVEEEQAL